MHTAVADNRAAIAELCRRYRVRRLDVFGSAARGSDFDTTRSDADLLVEFEPGQDPGMAGFMDLKQALELAIGRPVDLVDRLAVERSRNYIRRRQILGEAEALYVAG